ncbi:RDD family protein [Demequina activiva]|uniref:RDD domain-containing protein n=1 Tax=Demequina activiva TaxID=1582364 RepID=A0A919UM68_9MICO|nr:RDD family protein [Demequina activiva]GIG55393.1 hypothetical protein Dac01nite_21450 [Demequina activiva]
MDPMDDEILTGEGVALSTGAAAVTNRMLSGVIDLLVYGVPTLMLTLWMAGATLLANAAIQRAVMIGTVAIMLIVVPAVVETFTRGRSVGRLACGLRVVRDDGGPISFRHAFARSLTGLVEVFLTLGVLAITVSVLSARAKRLGDMLAGTYAMRVRGSTRALPPVQMPPHLAAWARNADIARLPDGFALTCRMFLARAATLHPGSRARLATELSGRMSDYVSPPPPAHTHPEDLVAAVLAERGRREHGIEERRRARADAEATRLDVLPYGVPDVVN